MMTPHAPQRARILLGLTVAFALYACSHATASEHFAGAARKLAQDNTCSTWDVRSFYLGEQSRWYSPCSRCSGGRVAWCCRSDDYATPDSCKLAGASCCSGPEYYYTYYERDGDLEHEDLDDVWCMPSTCTATFTPPTPNTPKPTPPPTNNACVTRNERRDHVGEYKKSRNQFTINRNRNICSRCAARNQQAWCCRSDDFASTDPLNCKPAKTGANCCDGNEYLYTDDDGDMDRMDDVWCLPATCRAP